MTTPNPGTGGSGAPIPGWGGVMGLTHVPKKGFLVAPFLGWGRSPDDHRTWNGGLPMILSNRNGGPRPLNLEWESVHDPPTWSGGTKPPYLEWGSAYDPPSTQNGPSHLE